MDRRDSVCHPRFGKREGLSCKSKKQCHDVYLRDKLDQKLIVCKHDHVLNASSWLLVD